MFFWNRKCLHDMLYTNVHSTRHEGRQISFRLCWASNSGHLSFFCPLNCRHLGLLRHDGQSGNWSFPQNKWYFQIIPRPNDLTGFYTDIYKEHMSSMRDILTIAWNTYAIVLIQSDTYAMSYKFKSLELQLPRWAMTARPKQRGIFHIQVPKKLTK